jgi:hypothetical protein
VSPAGSGRHDVLVWQADGSELSSRGERVPAGWVWTCECGQNGVGLPTEDAADMAAIMHEQTTWSELTRVLLASDRRGELAVSGLETSPQGRKLWAYWTRGLGAAKIGWGAPDDFDRCVAELAKYVSPGQVKGLCATMHIRATGMTTAEHAKLLSGGAKK